MSGDVQVEICPEQIAEDEKWDGLKGYLTNTDLPAGEVCVQYNGLWVVERAYRNDADYEEAYDHRKTFR